MLWETSLRLKVLAKFYVYTGFKDHSLAASWVAADRLLCVLCVK